MKKIVLSKGNPKKTNVLQKGINRIRYANIFFKLLFLLAIIIFVLSLLSLSGYSRLNYILNYIAVPIMILLILILILKDLLGGSNQFSRILLLLILLLSVLFIFSLAGYNIAGYILYNIVVPTIVIYFIIKLLFLREPLI